MAQGDPIKRNCCIVCGKPNAVGVKICKHCGGECAPKIIGYSKADNEETPKEPPPKRPPGNFIPL